MLVNSWVFAESQKSVNFSKSLQNPNLIDIVSGLYLNKNISVINRKSKENQTNYNNIIFPQNLNKGKKIIIIKNKSKY